MMDSIKLVALDVDGTLTDGKIYIDSLGVETKAFNVKDGMAISLAIKYGLIFCIITGRKSDIVELRAKELKINEIYQGVHNKIKVLDEIRLKYKLDWKNILFVGDDINDIKAMKTVGYSASPADASKIVRDEVNIVSKYNGGDGAVREIIDLLLVEKGIYEEIILEYSEVEND